MPVTKADLIRQYLAKFPELGPSALAKKLMEDHPKLNVRSQEISTLRSRLAQKKEGGHPAGVLKEAEKKTGTDVAETVVSLKRAVEILGKDQVKKILDVL